MFRPIEMKKRRYEVYLTGIIWANECSGHAYALDPRITVPKIINKPSFRVVCIVNKVTKAKLLEKYNFTCVN